jgi:hypothetical protein
VVDLAGDGIRAAADTPLYQQAVRHVQKHQLVWLNTCEAEL